ncbi:adenylate kinase [Fibrivirga algicola]|uniref:Adenylate kinase n=1 Tax=Fibrivirga algicola TaxID=2950420 RepID=A0ABX0QMF1_9BACT|nr:adenylate kinase [Fibrivirga algicola]NID11968.1 adenylate kinase [Fibrivirga algicola]
MLNLVLFGPPGAGKGTQSEKLIQKYQLVHLSTGDILRSQIAAGTELGLHAKSLMDQGLLVPDEVVIGMIEAKLTENQDVTGFIFDGFPRTVKQAEALDTLLSQHGTSITTMVALVVDEEELIRRLLKRGETSGRPDDKNEATARRRVSVYNSETMPVAEHYEKQGKYAAISGVGTIEDIFELVCQKIQQAQHS